MDDRLTPDAAQAARLVAARLPRLAGLPVTAVVPGGWSNRTFRLGGSLAARLPSAARYSAQPQKEHRWLPHLAAALPVETPCCLALLPPGEGYPYPWSLRRWIEGRPVAVASLADPVAMARALALYRRALDQAPTAGGPAPGSHNFHRGGALDVYNAEVQTRLDRAGLAGAALWAAALQAPATGQAVWVHGDLSPANLLTRDGRLAAVIDYGNCAIGDPACDLVATWTLFEGDARSAFRTGVAANPSTWARARGWALWKALLIMTGASGRQPAERPAEAVLADLAAEAAGPDR